ncbi:ketopantoate reductase family protein [Halodesulfurarchaeum sp. HSR-GB]|uniref:ketopantoate reductase family protein n=1 Tax=Halodesulfurarchaeum sp. HSR-GB TaxID=3074077 RepID=UPI00285C59CB|nr:ketopantoate reductase family protein [Halodesulfurarchaeum sp. HSR-GB]MDR5657088.1 ketopantoate reductase family protein [Halodesulfurarchaeum sp. HSR-GB]
MRVAILGAGAIGSALAGALSKSATVTLIGHENDHLRALQRGSLQIEYPDEPAHSRAIEVDTDPSAVAGTDLLILAVKSYDTDTAMAAVQPFLDGVDVLTLQNGLGNIETIREAVGENRVIAGTTTMAAFVPEPGRVRLESRGQIRIGRPWGGNEGFVTVTATFREAGFDIQIESDIRTAIWEKVLVNVGINPVTALGRVPNGHLRSGPGRELLEAAIEEAARVAAAEGYRVSNPVEQAVQVVEDTATNRSSMLQDLKRGTRTEIDSLNGAIVDRAEEHNIPVPVNRTLAAAIRLASSRAETHPSNGSRE